MFFKSKFYEGELVDCVLKLDPNNSELNQIQEEEEFEKSPFDSKIKNGVVYGDSCFKNPEVCYTIATIDYSDEPDIKSMGMQAFDLDEQDEKDFKKLIQYACQFAVKEFNTGNYQ